MHLVHRADVSSRRCIGLLWRLFLKIGLGFRLSLGRIGWRRGCLLSTRRLLLLIGRPFYLLVGLLRRWRLLRRLRLPVRTILSSCRVVEWGIVRWRRCC